MALLEDIPANCGSYAAEIYSPVSVEKILKLLSQYPQAIIKRLSAVTQKQDEVGVTDWSNGSPRRRLGWIFLEPEVKNPIIFRVAL